MVEPGRRARLEFRDYLQAGDLLALGIDLANNRILGAQISTYIGTLEDSVSLTVGFATFADGATIYPDQITLDAKAKQVKVTTENSGYRKAGT